MQSTIPVRKTELKSQLGQGTTIDLWLPISSEPASRAGPTQEQPANAVKRCRVLLVDDEDLVRMSTAAMLNDLGYEIVEAASGEEALRLLSDDPPDLLLTDHLMPGINGVELARKAREQISSLPVLIISGYAEVDGIAPDLPRLTKPFRNSELADQLAALSSY